LPDDDVDEEEEEEEFDDDDDDDMVPSDDSEELTTPSMSDAQGPEESSSSSASSIKNRSGPYVLPVKPISNKVGTVTMNMFTDKNTSSTTSALHPDQDVSTINLNLDALTSGLAIKEPPQLLSSVKMTEAMKAKSTAIVTATEAPPTTSDHNSAVAATAIANVSADE
jgi:hypothetical protein